MLQHVVHTVISFGQPYQRASSSEGCSGKRGLLREIYLDNSSKRGSVAESGRTKLKMKAPDCKCNENASPLATEPEAYFTRVRALDKTEFTDGLQ